MTNISNYKKPGVKLVLVLGVLNIDVNVGVELIVILPTLELLSKETTFVLFVKVILG
jgi:hypothetical protein